MIMPMTRLLAADNSGARIIQCIGMLGGGRRVASVGRVINIVVKTAKPGEASKVKPGEIYQALVIRTRKEWGRADGRWIRFDDNAAVLLHRPQLNKETGKKDKYGKLVGTRVVGPVPMELRKGGWLKMLSLSSRVI